MTTKAIPFKLICPKCRGDDVGYDATASWNVATQALELGSHFDATWCNECGDVDLKKVAVTAEEVSEAAELAKGTPEAAQEALQTLLKAARALDARLNDEGRCGGPQPPNGDDYNDLFGLIEAAAQIAGLSVT